MPTITLISLLSFLLFELISSASFKNLSQILSKHSSTLSIANLSIFNYKQPLCKDERINKFYGPINENLTFIACKNLQYDFFQDIDTYSCINKICSGNVNCTFDYENNYVSCDPFVATMGYFLSFDNLTYPQMIKNVTQDVSDYILSNYTNNSISSIEEFSSFLKLASVYFPFTQYAYLEDLPKLSDLSYTIHYLLLNSNISRTSTVTVSNIENFLSLVIDNFGTYIDYTDYILTYLPDSLEMDKVYTKISLNIYDSNLAQDAYLNFSVKTNSNESNVISNTGSSLFSSFFILGNDYLNLNYTQRTPFIFIPKSITQSFTRVKYVVIQIKDPRIYITKGSPGIKSQLVLVKGIGDSKQELTFPNTPDAIRIIIPWAFPPLMMKQGFDIIRNCRMHQYNQESNSWTQVFGIIDPNSNQYYVIIYVNNFGLFGVSCINVQKASVKISLSYLISNSFSLILLIILILIL